LQSGTGQDIAGLSGVGMPTPVAFLLNSPVMTFSFGRSKASGCRLLLSSIVAPLPLAHQLFGLMPLPMNRAANRLGKVALEPGTDSLA